MRKGSFNFISVLYISVSLLFKHIHVFRSFMVQICPSPYLHSTHPISFPSPIRTYGDQNAIGIWRFALLVVCCSNQPMPSNVFVTAGNLAITSRTGCYIEYFGAYLILHVVERSCNKPGSQEVRKWSCIGNCSRCSSIASYNTLFHCY